MKCMCLLWKWKKYHNLRNLSRVDLSWNRELYNLGSKFCTRMRKLIDVRCTWRQTNFCLRCQNWFYFAKVFELRTEVIFLAPQFEDLFWFSLSIGCGIFAFYNVCQYIFVRRRMYYSKKANKPTLALEFEEK